MKTDQQKNESAVEDSRAHWQALRLFNLYRLILSLSFLTIYSINIKTNFFNITDLKLYEEICLIYLGLNIIFLLISIAYKRHYQLQANIPIYTDLIAILIIMHLSGGILSGLGILFIIIIAAHGLLVPGKFSYLSAAFATIGLILEQTYSVFNFESASSLFTQVGLLGIVIFATALVTSLLGQRAIQSQQIVANQRSQLALIQQLNAHVISAMHAGVMVLDNQEKVRLVNAAAKMLLGIGTNQRLNTLSDLPSFFQEAFFNWTQKSNKALPKEISLMDPDIRLSFHPLGTPLSTGTLIFIYNTQEENRHAQNLKISSLGHLTANIAHELRNPLGAASHATQLLAESTQLSPEDIHLINLIQQACDRMNKVIQNVLSLSGRKPSKIETIDLIPWLEQFINELIIADIPNPKITLVYERKDISIIFDPTQLTQILINLCENGLRYSMRKNNEPTLILRVTTAADANEVNIHVVDQGEGIPPEVANHIFEPFFTTEKSGSGLGLYIARELTQMNGAKLDLTPHPDGGQFRISIPQGELL